MRYLDRGEIPLGEHVLGLGEEQAGVGVADVARHVLAGVGVAEAGADAGPVAGVGNPIAEPPGVVGELVLEEGAVEDDLPVAAVGDGEGEDDEEHEGGDDEEHREEVEPEQPREAVACPGEARERHHHERHSDGQQRPLQEP